MKRPLYEFEVYTPDQYPDRTDVKYYGGACRNRGNVLGIWGPLKTKEDYIERIMDLFNSWEGYNDKNQAPPSKKNTVVTVTIPEFITEAEIWRLIEDNLLWLDKPGQKHIASFFT